MDPPLNALCQASLRGSRKLRTYWILRDFVSKHGGAYDVATGSCQARLNKHVEFAEAILVARNAF